MISYLKLLLITQEILIKSVLGFILTHLLILATIIFVLFLIFEVLLQRFQCNLKLFAHLLYFLSDEAQIGLFRTNKTQYKIVNGSRHEG